MEKNKWEIFKKSAYGILDPLVSFLARIGLTPNSITIIGFLVTILASGILVYGAEVGLRDDSKYITLFGVTLLLAGVFDMLDGHLARKTGKMSVFGAFFDSIIDRYSEMVMFFGIAYYLVSFDYFLSGIFSFIAMIGSIMVSYARARGEGLGYDCKVGMMQRPERILLIGITAILYGVLYSIFGYFKYTVDGFSVLENISIFTIPIFILAVLTNYTAYQRINYCKKIMK